MESPNSSRPNQVPAYQCNTALYGLTNKRHLVAGGRDVPGKEREKTGTGKKLERTLFFPFPFLYFLTTFFPVFGENRQKCVKKGLEGRKKGWKDVERRRTAVPRRSKLSNMARFHFLCRLKSVFAPVPTRFLPRSKPVFAPFHTRSCPFLILLSYHI